MGKYANIHGAPAAANYVSSKLKHSVSESTVMSIRKVFKQEESKRRRRGEVEPVSQLPEKNVVGRFC